VGRGPGGNGYSEKSSSTRSARKGGRDIGTPSRSGSEENCPAFPFVGNPPRGWKDMTSARRTFLAYRLPRLWGQGDFKKSVSEERLWDTKICDP